MKHYNKKGARIRKPRGPGSGPKYVAAPDAVKVRRRLKARKRLREGR